MRREHHKPGTVQIALDVSIEAKKRFEALHKSLGFPSKAKTFEAIVYLVSTEDKIDPEILKAMDLKLDRILEHFENSI